MAMQLMAYDCDMICSANLWEGQISPVFISCGPLTTNKFRSYHPSEDGYVEVDVPFPMYSDHEQSIIGSKRGGDSTQTTFLWSGCCHVQSLSTNVTH